MAYRAEYKIKKKSRFGTNQETKNSEGFFLSAKFRFWKETPPKKRAEVRKRINSFLDDAKVREKHYDVPAISSDYLHDRHLSYYGYVTVTGFLSRLSLKFDVDASWDRIISQEQLVDLDAINNYVLTGEESEKRK